MAIFLSEREISNVNPQECGASGWIFSCKVAIPSYPSLAQTRIRNLKRCQVEARPLFLFAFPFFGDNHILDASGVKSRKENEGAGNRFLDWDPIHQNMSVYKLLHNDMSPLKFPDKDVQHFTLKISYVQLSCFSRHWSTSHRCVKYQIYHTVTFYGCMGCNLKIYSKV